jgi:hypothetical protein
MEFMNTRTRAMNAFMGKKNPKKEKTLSKKDLNSVIDIVTKVLESEGKWEINYREIKAEYDSLEAQYALLLSAHQSTFKTKGSV